MRFLVIVTACLGLVSALPAEFPSPRTSEIDLKEQGVNIVPLPTVYQDTDNDGQSLEKSVDPSKAAGSAEYDAGYQAGLRDSSSSTTASPSSASPSSASPAAIKSRIGFTSYSTEAPTNGSSFVNDPAAANSSAAATAQTQIRYAAPIVEKNFYYHVAPEDPQADAEASQLTITPRQHYKVIFIKAPTVSANAGATSSAASRTEEKTLVYVLVNKPVQAPVSNNPTSDGTFVAGKPEVYFVKYQGKDVETIANGRAISSSSSNADRIANANAFAGPNSNGGDDADTNAAATTAGGYGDEFGKMAGYANGNAGSNDGGATPADNRRVDRDIAY